MLKRGQRNVFPTQKIKLLSSAFCSCLSNVFPARESSPQSELPFIGNSPRPFQRHPWAKGVFASNWLTPSFMEFNLVNQILGPRTIVYTKCIWYKLWFLDSRALSGGAILLCKCHRGRKTYKSFLPC